MNPFSISGIKRLFVVLLLIGGVARGGTAVDEGRKLIGRVTPTIAGRFELEEIPPDAGCDVFEIEARNDKVVLRGNNGISLASAYHRYLQDYCKCLYSLWGDQMRLPDPLPTVEGKVRVVTQRRIRHFFNYCTFNYSGSWWDWADWGKIIDWMAMNGINMPLQIVGTEAVWYHSLRELGLDDTEARACLPAPVYFNWQWMGNLEGTGGPLPLSWIESHEKLGRRIMEREQSLGMTPILHGFSGVVPRVFRTRFPDARIDMKPSWGRGAFVGTATLDPMDPLFGKVARTYLSELVKRLGTSHLYITDPFHESSPPVKGGEYLRNVAGSIDKCLLDVDPKAIWVCQDWSFYPDIIRSIPKDRLIIMSLTGKKVPEFKDWGYRYTLGQLNSFGGETHLHGSLFQEQQNGVAQVMKESPNCVGSGNWMEGLENSPSYYHFMLDLNWEAGPVELEQKLDAYCERRYGGITDNIRAMNRLLIDSVYKLGGHGFSSVVAARPAVFPLKSTPCKEIQVPKASFDKHVLAWKALLADRSAEVKAGGITSYAITVAGPVWWLANTQLSGLRADSTGNSKTRIQYVLPMASIGSMVASIIGRARALGLPIQMGTVDPTFTISQKSFSGVTFLAAIQKVLEAVPDAVCWIDYAAQPYPSFNVSRRSASVETVDLVLGEDQAVGVKLKPRRNLRPSGIRVTTTTRNVTTGKIEFGEQIAGTGARIVADSGPELLPFEVPDNLPSVTIQTSAIVGGWAEAKVLDSVIAQAIASSGDITANPISGTDFLYTSNSSGSGTNAATFAPAAIKDTTSGAAVASGAWHRITNNASLPDFMLTDYNVKSTGIRVTGTYRVQIGGTPWSTSTPAVLNALRYTGRISTITGYISTTPGIGQTTNYYISVDYSIEGAINTGYPSSQTVYEKAAYQYLTAPPLLASNMFDAANFIPYEGTVEISRMVPPRQWLVTKINVHGAETDWKTAGALVQRAKLTLLTNEVELTCGSNVPVGVNAVTGSYTKPGSQDVIYTL
ncbi:alpha-N-acetylglucosaminidase N-terminal domain-containing protein [Luteolibacter ambystomatis]|uniref:Alpha-N-acetylglucosaminidase N-terminal domain-containing protein n=1 Tax=Luteolibacter ambystomatis TaxID=2824561 RepID=A0A975J0T4_9BACT|nr:alpha-N-acetylglucosaminidase [Luteolibacter ambystomatis]QUE51937.1 alpha-N-acetylglucosaminidase N-terminal domain-containing protein [Luteolibacter ambystomatis]